jgi:hypothetical protein
MTVVSMGLPYLAVAVGLYGFSSAWTAILLYHGGILALLSVRGGAARLREVGRGWNVRWAVACSAAGAAGGALLYVLWPPEAPAGAALAEILSRLGLRDTAWRLFAIYFVTVHPLLEEIHWRGTLSDPRLGVSARDLAFAGYHAPVLVLLITGPLLAAALVALAAAAWAWRALAARLGGLAVPFVSHAAADLAVVTVCDRLLLLS